jgi:RHS repeat-associated protein
MSPFLIPTQTIDGLTPTVSLVHGYDAGSRMTSSSAAIGSTADYLNSYAYDAQNRLTALTQSGQSGNAVSPKRVDFIYNALGQFSQVDRYASTTTASPVASTEYGYDGANRPTTIEHSGSSFAETHSYEYDAANRVAHYESALGNFSSDYTYDKTGQLTVSDYTGGPDDESYDYDANGNRTDDITNATGTFDYTAGKHNRLTSDGTYTYEYDDEGNIISREGTGSEYGHRFYYTWDNRNRLIHISEFNSDHEVLIVDYVYDAFNQLVGIHTSQPFGEGDSSTALVYDNGQVVLQFDAQFGYSSPVDLEATDLSHRYVWNPQAVDQLLADENIWSLLDTEENETLWALADRQGSVTDMVDDAGRLRIHRQFDSFGNIVDETHYDTDGFAVSGPVAQFGYLDEAFAYTGRFFDKNTGLQNNLNRWYDASIGRWMSEDPTGFDAGDANLYRYVGNSPVNGVDPEGLASPSPGYGSLPNPFWPPTPQPKQKPTPAPSPTPAATQPCPVQPSIYAYPEYGTEPWYRQKAAEAWDRELKRVRWVLGIPEVDKGGWGGVQQKQAVLRCEEAGRLQQVPPPVAGP